MDAITKDKRFSQIATDPRFHKMKKKDRMVTIDKRFHGMFNDKQFKLKYTVDKRGRPVRTTTNDHLQKYYDLSCSDEGSSENEESEEGSAKILKKRENVKSTQKQYPESDDEENDGDESDEAQNAVQPKNASDQEKGRDVSNTIKKKGRESTTLDAQEVEEEEEEEDHMTLDHARGQGNEETSSEEDSEEEDGDSIDLARGEGNEETSSSSSADSDDEEFQDDKFDHKWGELHHTAPPAEEVTKRLAVCNMDWDRIKASDLFVLLNSFKPTGGVITSVSIYPSEFGKERMAEEDVRGPKELVERGPNEPEDYEEGSELQREKMRQYQLNRLRYYYAVVECDTPNTANAIYEECDSIEYESTATRMDLRFIPNGMEFEDTPKSVATSAPDLATYKPKQFMTTALQQSKVDLTWDETDKERTAVTMRKFTKEDLEQLDMKEYLASSESENDEDPYAGFIEQPDFGYAGTQESEEKVLEQYNEMIKGTKSKSKKEKKSDVDIEISWDPDLKDEAEGKLKKKAAGPNTPWEQYLNKKKDKKKSERNKKHDNKKEGKGVQGKAEIKDEGEDKNEVEAMTSIKKRKIKKKAKPSMTKSVEVINEDRASGSDPEGAGDCDGGMAAEAFSDDELPSDVDMDDDFFKDEHDQPTEGPVVNRKKKKKGRKEQSEESKKKQAELAMLMMDEDDGRQHFNLKAIMENEGTNLSKTKKKKLKKLKKKQEKERIVKQAEDTFNVDVSDSRFDDIFKNPLYNIDPSAPEFKATKATDALIKEKQRRRRQDPAGGATGKAKKRSLEGSSVASAAKLAKPDKSGTESGKPVKDLALASLVKSVKAKTQTINQKKRR